MGKFVADLLLESHACTLNVTYRSNDLPATACRGNWNYLTVQLARTSEDEDGDPDLYGLFTGGTSGQVISIAAMSGFWQSIEPLPGLARYLLSLLITMSSCFSGRPCISSLNHVQGQ